MTKTFARKNRQLTSYTVQSLPTTHALPNSVHTCDSDEKISQIEFLHFLGRVKRKINRRIKPKKAKTCGRKKRRWKRMASSSRKTCICAWTFTSPETGYKSNYEAVWVRRDTLLLIYRLPNILFCSFMFIVR